MTDKQLIETLLKALQDAQLDGCWCEKNAQGPQRDHTVSCRESTIAVYKAKQRLLRP